MNETCREHEELLDDLADGLLAAEEAAREEAHTRSCPRCGAALREIEALRAAADRLPRWEDPPRDLWPAIRTAAESPGRILRFPKVQRVAVAGWLAAAAMAALALALVIQRAPEPGPSTGGATALASWRDAEEEFARAALALRQALDAREEGLSPEAREVLERNLRIVDDAIREVTETLEREPDRSGYAHQLASLYGRKIQILEQAVRLTAHG